MVSANYPSVLSEMFHLDQAEDEQFVSETESEQVEHHHGEGGH